jgi:GntR family transcriptional regulator
LTARKPQQIADDLRKRILQGEFPPGSKLPKIRDLASELEVNASAVSAAYRILREERLVETRRSLGTLVLDPTARQRLPRSAIRRDDRGYYLDAGNQRWDLLTHSGVVRAPVPPDVATLLGIPPGEEAVIRDRVLGLPRSPASGRNRAVPMQVSTSYLPLWLLAEIPRVGEPETGPGGIYDRVEEHFGVPLEWTLITSAELATGPLSKRLSIPRLSSVLRQLRVTSLPKPDGRVVEVLDQRVSGDRFEIQHPLPRGRSAAWPPSPAGQNTAKAAETAP